MNLGGDLYENVVALAPMVRAGTLPLRLLALRYGADTVYGEEIIDRKILATTRIENNILNTVDYVIKGEVNSTVFRTCAEEKQRVIYQIGTADATLALKAAEYVAKDVAAIDINMGCPKHFSIQGGMGAALMSNVKTAEDIIKTLQRNLNIPVSCKIRLLNSTSETIDFAKSMANAGARSIGIHARHTNETPGHRAHWDELEPICSSLSIPVIANGDVFTRRDIDELKKRSKCSSVMIARGALHDPSIFRAVGLLPRETVIQDYLKIAADYDNVYQNTKYYINRLHGSKDSISQDLKDVQMIKKITTIKTVEALYDMWHCKDYLLEKQKHFQTQRMLPENAPVFEPDKEPKPCGIQEVPNHGYDDEFQLKLELYCEICNLQLTGIQDKDVHMKGKKHKRKVRISKASTISVENLEDKCKKQRLNNSTSAQNT